MTILKNVPLKSFRRFLKENGLNHIGDKGGHEKWSKKDLIRPVILQSHIDPIPIHIVKSNLNTMGLKLKDLELWLLDN